MIKDIKNVDNNVKEISNDHEDIMKILEDILNYVKNNEKTNRKRSLRHM